jgi:hypothetical protein
MPHMNAPWIRVLTVASVLSLVGGGVALRQAFAAAPPQRLPAPKHMPADAIATIKARMHRHGNTMSSLLQAVVLLDRPAIRTLAGRIADEEIVAGLEAGKDLKPLLPSEFFDQQDILRDAAQQLAVAARAEGDDKVLADRFATVTRTCVTCHGIYLRHGPIGRPSGTAPSGEKSPAPVPAPPHTTKP